MTPEGRVKNGIKSWLEAEGLIAAARVKDALDRGVRFAGWYYMPVASMYSVKGIPDFIGIWRAVGFGIEAKAPGESPTELQSQQHEAIRLSGGICFVVDRVSQLADFKAAMEQTWKNAFSKTPSDC